MGSYVAVGPTLARPIGLVCSYLKAHIMKTHVNEAISMDFCLKSKTK